MELALAESIPDVGSSRKSTSGFLASAMAMESRRFKPLDKPRTKALPALVCCASVRPTSSIRASIDFFFSEEDR